MSADLAGDAGLDENRRTQIDRIGQRLTEIFRTVPDQTGGGNMRRDMESRGGAQTGMDRLGTVRPVRIKSFVQRLSTFSPRSAA